MTHHQRQQIGRSLNYVLHVGPKLQNDVFDVTTKWRTWKYVITADAEKNFRQIWVDEDGKNIRSVGLDDISHNNCQVVYSKFEENSSTVGRFAR